MPLSPSARLIQQSSFRGRRMARSAPFTDNRRRVRGVRKLLVVGLPPPVYNTPYCKTRTFPFGYVVRFHFIIVRGMIKRGDYNLTTTFKTPPPPPRKALFNFVLNASNVYNLSGCSAKDVHNRPRSNCFRSFSRPCFPLKDENTISFLKNLEPGQ